MHTAVLLAKGRPGSERYILSRAELEPHPESLAQREEFG
jgi:hypothetical protein